MIPYLFSSILWAALIALDLIITRKLYSMYRRDNDLQKLMFTIGLLICMPVYALAIVGIDSFPLARNVFDWSPLPILLAFGYTLLNDRFSLDIKKCYKLFLVGTAFTVALFFFSPSNISMPFLLAGLIFAMFLSVVQYSRKFDLASVTLFLSMPSFAVCFLAIGLGMEELALFSGFAAKIALLIAFEISKGQLKPTSSILVLKKKLSEAQENFSKLFSILPDPAIIVDGNGKFLALASNVTTITGFQKEELIGANFMTTDLITANSKATVVKNLAKRMLGFHIAPYEIELRVKDGKKMQFELNALKIEYEGNPAVMVIFRDLTERNRLLKSLEQEQQRFQSIAESSGVWIWEVDSYGNYIYSNPVVEKILGYTSEEMIGRNCLNLLCKNDKKQTECLKALFISKESFVFTKQCLHKRGHISILESQGMPVYNDEGKFVGYRGVDRDVTEKKEMETKLVKSERFAAIGELATMVAHDLRNPLQGIATAVHYVKKATENVSNEKMTCVLQRIDDSVKYSEKIVRDLLDFSEDFQLQLVAAEPKSIVSQALSGMAIPAKVKLIDKTQEKPKIDVDLNKIGRVIVNLVSNAFDAMPNGGTLTISSKEVEKGVEFAFMDNGIGIPPENIDKLWAPFATTKAKGMGLGLPICKRIVEAHGGQIAVESESGKGAIFKVFIPSAASEQKRAEFTVNEVEGILENSVRVNTFNQGKRIV